MDKFTLIVPIHSQDFESELEKYLKNDIGDIVIILTGDKKINLKDERVKIFTREGFGYGEAVNFASNYARNEYLLICNDDVIFFDDFFENLKKVDVDVSVPLVINFYTKKIESFGSKIFLFYNILNKDLNQSFKHLHVVGTCFIIKRKIFEKVKRFDKDYFMYYEDVDLSLRVKKITQPVFEKELKIYHKHSASNISKKRYFLQRNRLLFVLKNFDFKNLLLFCLIFLFVEPVVIFLQILREKSLSPLKARLDFFKMSKMFLRKRYENFN